MFSLRTADFDNNSLTSKAAICSKLSIGLEAESEKEKETFLMEMCKKKYIHVILSSCKYIDDYINIILILPVHAVSGSDMAFRMSAVGFNNPSWIILVLSS